MDDFKGKRKLQDKSWYMNYYNDCFANYEDSMSSSSVLKQFKEKAEYLSSKFSEPCRLLDVGCATGVFLNMMKKKGWDVEGIEISEELASYVRSNFSIKTHTKDLTREKLIGEPFHVITLFDVIEHIPDPNLMISACKSLLAPGGILLMRTPTEEGLLRDIAKTIYRMSLKKIEFPMHWFYSFEHIHSFSFNTLSAILEKHGFSVIKVFREEESLGRINIPGHIRAITKSVGLLSALLNKQHKMVAIARK